MFLVKGRDKLVDQGLHFGCDGRWFMVGWWLAVACRLMDGGWLVGGWWLLACVRLVVGWCLELAWWLVVGASSWWVVMAVGMAEREG